MHVFRVVAADTRGAMGLPSRTVRVRVRHSRAGHARAGCAIGQRDRHERRARLGTEPQAQLADRRVPDLPRRPAGAAGRGAERDHRATSRRRPDTGSRSRPSTGGDTSGPPIAAQTTTAMPPPTRASLHAFLLATTDESFVDLQRHYRQIGTRLSDLLRLPPQRRRRSSGRTTRSSRAGRRCARSS